MGAMKARKVAQTIWLLWEASPAGDREHLTTRNIAARLGLADAEVRAVFDRLADRGILEEARHDERNTTYGMCPGRTIAEALALAETIAAELA
ncbi:MAG: hypothetical protein JST54_35775 [Deltaproteobacteria bacterium]|nr:hypothetical protein [Deltaproteobacteria bacterium]